VIKSKLWLENLKRKGHSEDLGVGGMIMLEWKVKLSLCLTKHHTMEAYWGVEV
jgi:hypothetical protein